MIAKLYADRVALVCVECGSESEATLADLVAGLNLVALPCCGACQTRTTVCAIEGPPDVKTSLGAVARQAAVKAIHAQLVGLGRLADGVTVQAIAATLHEGATAWPVGAEAVDVPLPADVVAKHAAWRAAQG